MRTILTVTFIAVLVGWIGATSGSAAPAGPAALGHAAGAVSPLTEAYYYRHHGRLCYAKCYNEFIFGRRVCRRYC